MLIRGQTTEDRISQIADGFNRGAQNFMQAQDRQRAQSLQAEALRRQQALQALEVSNSIANQTGKLVDPGQVAPLIQSGNLTGIGDLLKDAPLTPKFERELKAQERENLKFQQEQEKYNREKEEAIKPYEQTRDYQKAVAIANVKNNAKPTADSKVAQKQMEKLGTSNAGLYNVKSAMDEALKILKDPTVSEDQKIKTGQGLFKLLNSAEGSDAVGAEEAKRIGSYLEFNIGNFTQPGAFIGRDVKGFTDQISNYSNLLGQRIGKNEQGINALKTGNSLSSIANQGQGAQQAQTVNVSPQQVNAIKSMSDEELLRFVQGG